MGKIKGGIFVVGVLLSAAAAPGAAPSNDAFANAIAIPGVNTLVKGTNTAATKELNEPVHAGNAGGKSLWWKWTPLTNQTVFIDTLNSTFSTLLAVYTGTLVGSLTTIASDGDGSDLTNRLSFAAVGGTTYRIAVDGRDGASGTIFLNLRSAPPVNDDFAQRTSIFGTNATLSGTSEGAMLEPGEPAHTPATDFPPRHSVWWSWRPDFYGTVTVDTIGSSYDTYLAIYTGNAVDALTQLAWDDDSGGNFRSRLSIPCAPGVEYQIAVGGFGYQSTGSIVLHLVAQAARPPNDDLANRSLITGVSHTVTGSTVGATREANEPDQVTAGQTVWWAWVAPRDGTVVMDTIGSSFDTVLAVYTGTTISELSFIADDDDGGGGHASRLPIPVSAGVEYEIAVDASFGTRPGSVVLNVQMAPGNDNFADAFRLEGSNVAAIGTNVGATKEPGEPAHAGYAGGHSVWWSWTAPTNGLVEVNTIDSSFDTLLAVYTGTQVSALAGVASDDQSGGNDWSRLTFACQAGTVYRIAVDGYAGSIGNVALHLEMLGPPANDNFAEAFPLVGTNVTAAGSNLGASKEPGESNHGNWSGGSSVWWRWTAPASGPYVFETAGSSISAALGIYTGTSLSNLQVVADNSRAWVTHAIFHAVAGTTYSVAVDTAFGSSGDIALHLYSVPVPSNDNFSNAIPLVGTDVTGLGSNLGASGEPGEPDHAGYSADSSVWWTWTAPSTTTYVIETVGSSFTTVLGIYTGSSVSNLHLVASDVYGFFDGTNFSSRLVLSALAGTTYAIAVDITPYEWPGSIVLHIARILPPANDAFASAQVLVGTNLTVQGSTEAATFQAGEPASTHGQHSVWYAWTAPFNGRARVEAYPSSAFELLAFQGATLSAIQAVPEIGYAALPDAYEWRAVQGTEYLLRVNGEQGLFRLEFHFSRAPSNDDFATAIAVTGTNSILQGALTGATPEPGEPSLDPSGSDGSVWFNWTAPVSGKATARILTSGSFWIEAFTGNTVSNLTQLPTISYLFGPQTVWRLTAGTVYHVRVRGYGDFNLQLTVEPFLANDDFAHAQHITGTSATIQATTAGATHEEGEQSGDSVWYSWTAPFTGRASADVGYGHTLEAFTGGTLGELRTVAHLDFASVAWRVTNGVTYFLRVVSWYSDSPAFQLRLSGFAYPANDDFAHRIPIAAGGAPAAGVNLGATREEGEPRHAAQRSSSTVWWSWTASGTGQASVSTEASDFDTVLAVYTGEAIDQLTWVNADNDSGATNASRVVFAAVGGQTYQIAVAGFAEDSGPEQEGTISLRVQLSAAQPGPPFTTPAQVPNALFAKAGVVRAFYAQPDGKVIIGGDFSAVNGMPRRNIARLNENGTLDLTWNVDANGEVRVILLHETNVFLGGRFSEVNGVPRAGLAKVNAIDGQLDVSWDPKLVANGYGVYVGAVSTMAALGDSLYVGGNFDSIGGQYRTNLAKLAIIGVGLADPAWDVRVEPTYASVLALLPYQDQLIVGGSFTRIGGLERRSLAKVGLTGTGAVDPLWHPLLPDEDVGMAVEQMFIRGSSLIVAGSESIFGEIRRVALDGTGDVDPAWGQLDRNDGEGALHQLVTATDDALIVTRGYEDQMRISKLSLQDLSPVGAPWRAPVFRQRIFAPRLGYETGVPRFSALTTKGNRVLFGGEFDSAEGVVVLGLASMDSVTGEIDSSFGAFPQHPGTVLALGRQPDGKLVAGGAFDMVNDLPRANLVRFNPDGSIDPWFPNPDGSVTAILAADTNLFVTGYFRNVKGVAVPGMASFDYASDRPQLSSPIQFQGEDVTWLGVTTEYLFVLESWFGSDSLMVLDRANGQIETNHSVSGTAAAWQSDGKLILVGDRLSRIDPSPPFQVDLTWNPPFASSNGTPIALAVGGTNVFVGTDTGIWRYSLSGNGEPGAGWQSPDVLRDSSVASFGSRRGIQSLATLGNDLYAGGIFWPIGAPVQSVGGEGRTILARLDGDTGTIEALWNTGTQSVFGVSCLLSDRHNLYIGGDFSRFADEVRFGLALLTQPGGPTLLEEADGLITLLRSADDGPEITHFRIVGVTGGTLVRNRDSTPVQPGDFITVADGGLGLRFNPTTGLPTVTAVSAVSPTPGGAGNAVTTLDLQSPLTPVLSFSQEEYRISEASASVTVSIRKRGPGSGTVRITTSNGTATLAQFLDSGDYQGGSRLSTVSGTNLDVRINLFPDEIYEGDEVFYVTLSDPSPGTRLAYPSQARIVIIDDDAFGPNGSFLAHQLPAGLAAASAGLAVYLKDEVGGWRLTGEWDWHSSGDVVSGLIATNYQVEFKPLFGYVKPQLQTIPITAGRVNYATNEYAASQPLEGTGALAVILDPPEVAESTDPANAGLWHLAEETDTAWRRSGEVAANLSVGYHEIVIKPVGGYYASIPEPVVWVGPDRTRTNYAHYVRASGSGPIEPQVLTFAQATGSEPYEYNGQIKSRLGVGSGVVVKEGVVLTAAHLLFDDKNLELVDSLQIQWLFQRYRGQLEPPPQTPYGTVILDGYASQRTNDTRVLHLRPEVSSPGSQNLDVGLLFFLEPAGRDGFGGFFASDDPNEHLLSSRRKMLVGYPKDGVPENNQGKLHATVAQNVTFELLYPGKSVYVTTGLHSYPGNSGGPLYVEEEIGGRYFPAGVYVGQTSLGQSLVRGIDRVVVDYINRVEDLSRSGPNHPGGGFSPFIPGVTAQPPGTGLLTFELGPNAARAVGAGWRIRQNPDDTYLTNTSVTYPLTGGVDYDVEFRRVPGFITPPARQVRVDIGEVSTLKLRYIKWPAELETRRPDQFRLFGSNQGRYIIEYRTNLNSTSRWLPWRTVTLTNSPMLFDLGAASNGPQQFYRVGLTNR